MIKKLLHLFFGVVIAVGFFGLVGTAGASDLNMIGLDIMALRLICSLALMLLGLLGLKVSGCDCFVE